MIILRECQLFGEENNNAIIPLKHLRSRASITLLSLLPGAPSRILRRGFVAYSMGFRWLGEENRKFGCPFFRARFLWASKEMVLSDQSKFLIFQARHAVPLQSIKFLIIIPKFPAGENMVSPLQMVKFEEFDKRTGLKPAPTVRVFRDKKQN